MNSQEKNQQNMKCQIELLKQKYLKKNVSAVKIQDIPNTKIELQFSAKDNNDSKFKQQSLAKDQLSNNKQSQKIVEIMNKKMPILKQQFYGQSNWNIRTFITSQNLYKKQQQKSVKEQINQKDPFGLKINFVYDFEQVGTQQNTTSANCPEFQEINQKKQHRQLRKNSQMKEYKKEKNLSQACKKWVENPKKALIYLLFPDQYKEDQNLSLELVSKNPNFPDIVKNLAEQFVFKNEKILKQKQKQVVYNMALQYFSPSAHCLSDILLLCLVKIVPNYSTIYLDQIIRKMPFYMQKIVKYRKYLLKQQIQIFIKCIEERMECLRGESHQIPLQNIVWLLVVKPTSNYSHQILLTKNIQNLTQLMNIFCILQPDGRQLPLSILYLKCIDALIPLFVKNNILQKVIKHINQIKVPQALYKPVKSLKLKLIKAADPKQDKKKGEDQKGFTNFLSDKISALKQVVENKTKIKTKTQISYNVQTGLYQPVLPALSSLKLQN